MADMRAAESVRSHWRTRLDVSGWVEDTLTAAEVDAPQTLEDDTPKLIYCLSPTLVTVLFIYKIKALTLAFFKTLRLKPRHPFAPPDPAPKVIRSAL